MILETFPVGPLQCNCTIVGDETSRKAIVVDGGDGVDEVARRLEERGLKATLLIHTHAHIDHIYDIGRLRARVGGRALLHPADVPLYRALPAQAAAFGLWKPVEIIALDGDLDDGAVLRTESIALDVLHTPGHTPGSVCFAIHDGALCAGPNDKAALAILSGDTLFAGSIGRWDIGGTSMEDIIASIQGKLLVYNDATPVIPGHGPHTTIGVERRTNPYLR